MVFANPNAALAKAQTVLASDAPPLHASVAHQVIGTWHRDWGDLKLALRHLRQASRLAAQARASERESDTLAALGVALVHAGRTEEALETLEQAVSLGTGHTRARVLYRRAYAGWVLGRHRAALQDIRRAIPVLRQADDVIWTARALTLRATIHLALGAVDRADADFAAAERLWDSTGQDHDKADLVESRGLAAFRSGDVPLALRLLDDAQERYDRLGTPSFTVSLRRCEVLMAAGLAPEALAEADAALNALERIGGYPTLKAELLLMAARAALQADDPPTAHARAAAAVRLFAGQRRDWWEAHARLVQIEARAAASGRWSGRLFADAAAVAGRLAALGAPAAPEGSLLAGRIALALGWTADAERYLATAARSRHSGPPLARMTGWTAQALRARAAGSNRGALAACRRGLQVLDDYRMTLGASELRARATRRGSELAALGQQALLASGGPRRLLAWSERSRATTLSTPPTRPPADPVLQSSLTAFREIAARAEQARSDGRPIPALERDQRLLERDIRSRTLHLRGEPGLDTFQFDPAQLLHELGDDTRLLELIVVDGRVHVLVCGRGRVRRFEAGLLADAETEAEQVQAGLRRLAHPGADARLPLVEAAGRRLEEILLGPASAHLGAGPLVVVPPARLHRVPWALLPSLRERVLSVSPSASSWLRARATEPPPNGRHVFVRGPGLSISGTEVPELADRYGTTALENDDARVPRVLEELDGATLAHIAARGTFRADSPLFSSLRMADGPLIAHDFDRLDHSPYRIILSSSDAARFAPVGADELLGLVTVLLPLGTAGIVASSAPVNDNAAVQLMLALHKGLATGLPLAQALRDARLTLPQDATHQATGWAFTAFGAT
ncbi:CHAT domain-containing tetratricopeptide repeat protein [Streptomyces sp. NPDC050788]|uniref:CHAT domain-containing protein n=1 Tax=Streptomyces sp. NPDC050788 TaxID=3155041 RepID=UPI00341B0273